MESRVANKDHTLVRGQLRWNTRVQLYIRTDTRQPYEDSGPIAMIWLTIPLSLKVPAGQAVQEEVKATPVTSILLMRMG